MEVAEEVVEVDEERFEVEGAREVWDQVEREFPLRLRTLSWSNWFLNFLTFLGFYFYFNFLFSFFIQLKFIN